ncbi:MAG: putative collagen-binding protein [Thermoleophilia bacterium]|nr:putative collagen-binding protein [Thermoleophilia bacterium]
MSISLTVLVAACMAMVLAPSTASSATVTSSTTQACDTYASGTDWNRNLSLPKFNPSLGTLTNVRVTQAVAMRSEFKVESRNAAPRTDTFTLSNASVRIQAPGTSQLVASLPGGTMSRNFTEYDGILDYAGTSGWSSSFGNTSNQSTDNPSNLADWSGSGTVAIPASGVASTTNSLSGNFALDWDTQADARVCVTYTYLEQVLVCVGDYVWVDANKNGMQDAGEVPVGGRGVTVTDANGNVLGTTTTDGSGRWTVCGLEPSTPCVILVDLPDGYTITGADQGDDANDSDGVATGNGDARIPCVTPSRGSDLTFDVGIYPTPVVTPLSTPAPAPAVLRTAKRSLAGVIRSGGQTTFTVTIRNAGTVTVGDVTVCDTPPAALAFTSKPKGAFFRSGKLCWRITTLGAGKSVTFRYTMRAANVTRRSCVVNRVVATAAVGGSSASRAAVCIRPTTLKSLVLAG